MATSTSITSIRSFVDEEAVLADGNDGILALLVGATKDNDVSNRNDRHISNSSSDDDAVLDVKCPVMAV